MRKRLGIAGVLIAGLATVLYAQQPIDITRWGGVIQTVAAALADNLANPTAPHVGAFAMLWDGATWDRWPGTAADGGEVQVTVFPDNEPINAAQRGGVAVVAGACERETLLYIQINQVTGTQLITGTASERIYVCSFQAVTATAQNIALVDGTGSVCATSPTGLLGGSTAATGWNFAANGGIVLPPTRDSWTKTSTDADNVCLLQSGAGQISGSLTYISIPNI